MALAVGSPILSELERFKCTWPLPWKSELIDEDHKRFLRFEWQRTEHRRFDPQTSTFSPGEVFYRMYIHFTKDSALGRVLCSGQGYWRDTAKELHDSDFKLEPEGYLPSPLYFRETVHTELQIEALKAHYEAEGYEILKKHKVWKSWLYYGRHYGLKMYRPVFKICLDGSEPCHVSL